MKMKMKMNLKILHHPIPIIQRLFSPTRPSIWLQTKHQKIYWRIFWPKMIEHTDLELLVYLKIFFHCVQIASHYPNQPLRRALAVPLGLIISTVVFNVEDQLTCFVVVERSDRKGLNNGSSAGPVQPMSPHKSPNNRLKTQCLHNRQSSRSPQLHQHLSVLILFSFKMYRDTQLSNTVEVASWTFFTKMEDSKGSNSLAESARGESRLWNSESSNAGRCMASAVLVMPATRRPLFERTHERICRHLGLNLTTIRLLSIPCPKS